MTLIDLPESFAGIQEEFVAHARLDSLAGLAARGARRRWRSWAAIVGGVTALVAVLATSVVAVSTADRTPHVTQVLQRPPTRYVYETSVIDANTVVVKVGFQNKRTTAWSYTVDGGRTWRQSSMPAWFQPDANGITALGIDSRTFVLGNTITHDAGVRWERRPSDSGAALSALPPKWPLLSYSTVVSGGHSNTSFVGTIDPATGQLHPLTGVPADCGDPGDAPLPDGSLWLSCANGFVISHDRGASWEAHRFGKTLTQTAQVGTYDGRTFYAVHALAPVDKAKTMYGPKGRGELYVSKDTGRTWQPVRPLDDVISGIVVLPDNSFVLWGNNGLRRTTDLGQTFHQLSIAGTPGQASTLRRAGSSLYVASGFVTSISAEFMSTDGLHYRPVPHPPGVPWDGAP
ncbi:hypothetical protein GCM10009765_63990 [Fodinicola feengrottensis]|uniref:Exo-alpha-sialidase n=1 Tax=Fodinicola feengrottensis TaxID=435914 RepID=A0ABP4UN86_9ACTN